jgi:hypothetical protein
MDRGFVITIPMVEPSKATLRQDDHEALLSCPHALPTFSAGAMRDQADGLLDGVSVGFDTLLLRLAPRVTLTRTNLADSVRLVLRRDSGSPGADTPAGQPPVADPDQARTASGPPGAEAIASRSAADDKAASTTDATGDKAGALRLRLLGAELLAQSGQLGTARENFGALILAMPDSPEPINGLAGVHQRTGRWRQALALYRDAQKLDPEDPSITATIAAIERSKAGRLGVEFEYRRTEGGDGVGPATAAIGGISGEQPFGEGWRLGFSHNLAQVNAAQVQRSNGTVGSFIGPRQRSEFFLQHDDLDGTVTAASVYLTGDMPGFGARAELPDDSGTTFLRADYRRSNWDFFQSLVNNGTRDRVSAGRRQQITEKLTVRLDAGTNRYGFEGAPNLASTATITAEARLGDLGGVHGLSAAYVLDGEYVLGQAERTDANGKRFYPLQIVDREVHAAVLAYAGALGSRTDDRGLGYEVSAGYGVDRYGKAGPILAARLTYNLRDIELAVRAGYVRNIGRSPGSTAIIALSLTWFF